MSLQDLFSLGGWAMWPLLVFSITTVAIVLERCIYFFIHDLKTDTIAAQILEKIDSGNTGSAVALCQTAKKQSVAPLVFLSGLKLYELGEHRMEKAMETEASEQINRMETGFDLLIAIGSIAPITGFLGTVSGMIGAFQSIANAAEVNAQLVAGGIFEALITTAFGLSIAIVAITAYNIFAHVTEKFSARIEETGSRIITQVLVTEQRGTFAR
ncbi:MAG: MotA/TolQ/ExbB proton channel family protein [Spirochaetales bacterium]|nr:MotA/TolQ/ExbB proton channel family protein [Spirochaetales bacterium]